MEVQTRYCTAGSSAGKLSTGQLSNAAENCMTIKDP